MGYLLSLAWLHHLAFVKIWWEGAATRKDSFTISVFHGLLEGAFSIAGGIRQWEDDGVFVELCHLLENCLVENPTDCRQAHQDVWLDIINNFW